MTKLTSINPVVVWPHPNRASVFADARFVVINNAKPFLSTTTIILASTLLSTATAQPSSTAHNAHGTHQQQRQQRGKATSPAPNAERVRSVTTSPWVTWHPHDATQWLQTVRAMTDDGGPGPIIPPQPQMTPTNDNDAAAWPRNNDGTTTLMRPDSDTTNGTNGDERPTGPPPMTKPHTPQMATTAHRHPPDAMTTPRWNDHDTRRDHDTITMCQ
ncbi:hypothetical protein K443DRAFT_15126 [Laccaria amethystina LaAM-08-1]|uniref:Unplaced genomic scaffold K443scaffold_621, whole genome shotgun sequence n=1 Tax=Laccaria amethystina LaAM-08-1 TaxID=1095629 RepID=A0A0C9WRP6_9AGAR|nr:hypothetical protein K443DRAFT_15126 [Laccaria amethystina LaAM-08-1]